MVDGRESWSRRGGPAPGGSRPLAAAALSTLLPGAGQWLARRRRRGAVLVGLSALLTLSGLVIAARFRGGDGLDHLSWLLSARGLATVALANVALAAFRLGAVVDAWAAARRLGGRVGAAQVTGFAVLLLVGVMAPHAAVAFASAEARRVVEVVFADERAADLSDEASDDPGGDPDSTSDAGATEAAEATAEAGEDAVGGPDGSEGTGPALEPEPHERPTYGGSDRLTVLLLGSDAGPDRSGTRVDVMVVATMDINSGDVALISVPRNLADVPMPGVFGERLGERYPQRLMSLYPAAESDAVLADAYDDPGKQAHVAAVQTLLDLEIDHVAMVDLAGFVEVIDALGGVDVDVDRPIRVELSPPSADEDWRRYDIDTGRQHLDGHEALAYVRSRTGTDDYDRMRRQRCLLGSLAEQTGTGALLRSLPRLSDVLVERVATDIPLDALPDLARLGAVVDAGGMRTLGITPPTYTVGQNAHGFFSADVDGIQEAVRELLDEPAATPPGASDLGGTCG